MLFVRAGQSGRARRRGDGITGKLVAVSQVETTIRHTRKIKAKHEHNTSLRHPVWGKPVGCLLQSPDATAWRRPILGIVGRVSLPLMTY